MSNPCFERLVLKSKGKDLALSQDVGQRVRVVGRGRLDLVEKAHNLIFADSGNTFHTPTRARTREVLNLWNCEVTAAGLAADDVGVAANPTPLAAGSLGIVRTATPARTASTASPAAADSKRAAWPTRGD